MAEHTDRPDADPAPDLLSAASRTLEHARVALDLVARQVSLTGFQAPTEYQVDETARVVRAFVTNVTGRYLALVAAIDARFEITVDEVSLTAIDPALIAAALARADERWIAQALATGTNDDADLVAITTKLKEAELDLALLLSVSRDLDARMDPLMIEEDVDYRTLERLIWRIAAEVRSRLERRVGDVDDVDRVLTDAAKRFLGPRRRRPTAAAERLAKRLQEAETDFFTLLVAALGQAQPRIFCALIATRLALPTTFVAPALTQPERLALLLRAAGLSDNQTAGILLKLSAPLRLRDDRLIAIIDGYRSLNNRATVEMLRQMKLNPHYRAAIFEKEKSLAAA